jgi:hypothetical protein
MDNTKWTLWVIHATDGKRSELTHVYAFNEQHARERACTWVAAHPHLPEVHFRAFPGGFSMGHRWLEGEIQFESREQGNSGSMQASKEGEKR